MIKKILFTAALAVGLASGAAQAVTMKTMPMMNNSYGTIYENYGNDCSGFFGVGFANCSYNGSPIIARFNELDSELNNGIFGSVDGSEFSWTVDQGGMSGTWSYTLGANDPLLTAVIAKGGNGFVVFDLGTDFADAVNGVYSGTWFTEQGTIQALSFYDTGVPAVPLPAGGVLLVTAIAGLGFARRFRRA